MTNSEKMSLRFHDRSCWTCRYFRTRETGSYTSECLLLGRSLGISNIYVDLVGWARERVCDGWKTRPKTWGLFLGSTNPYFKDPYISKTSLVKIKKRAGLEQ